MGLKGAERAAALAAAKVNESNVAKDVEIADLRSQMARMEGLMERMVKSELKREKKHDERCARARPVRPEQARPEPDSGRA
jgi:hypothetical protein